ncbi:hypothetical protein PSCFBP2116_P300031 (plasmid) [Pseudomonas syringae]|nr:hypothetical protein PSCFBP2116_P300031 [Pseudomonas syringae]
MCKPVLRRDRLNFGYDNRFQNPTICSRRLPCSCKGAGSTFQIGKLRIHINIASSKGQCTARFSHSLVCRDQTFGTFLIHRAMVQPSQQ